MRHDARLAVLILVLNIIIVGGAAHAALIPSRSALRSQSPVDKIRVRISEGLASASVRGFDLTLREGSRSMFHADRSSEWRFKCSQGELEAEEIGVNSASVARRLRFSTPVSITTQAGFLSLEGKPFRETLHVHSGKKGCEIVNEIDVEDYLDGLVNAEFSAKWSEESVAAQVIAARTYAYHRILEARKKPSSRFDVESTVKDQVYGGLEKEDYLASRIVDRTRGMVLVASNGKPLKAFYHSTCGGRTELPQHVWGAKSAGFKRRVQCTYCKSSPVFSWSLALSEEQLVRSIREGISQDGVPMEWPAIQARQALDRGKIAAINLKLDDSGRVLEAIPTFDVSGVRVKLPISGVSFRNWLGPAKFRSTAFSAAKAGSVWEFKGRGNGHGVGMCQWGAKVMAEKGEKYSMILRHYYPDASVKKIW